MGVDNVLPLEQILDFGLACFTPGTGPIKKFQHRFYATQFL